MPDGIWLDNQTYNQTGGLLWAQQQMQNLNQTVQDQLSAGQDWANQQLQNLGASVAPSSPPTQPSATSPSGPAPEPPATADSSSPPISPEQQQPAATAQELGQQWATQQFNNLTQQQQQPPPATFAPQPAATAQDLGQQWANSQIASIDGGTSPGSGAAINTPVQGDQAAAARAQPTAVEPQRQFETEAGLSTADAYTACGPVAAMAFAQTYGRNPTPTEAMQLAQQVGWTGSKGMAGPASEVQLLQNMGVDAHATQGVNWGDVAQSASSGNPVILDTPGHYFYVDGYNADTGQYHVGASGTALRGGSEWMTPDQMGNVPATRGAPDAAIFANNPLSGSQGAPTSPTAPVTAPLSLSGGQVPPGPQPQQPGDLIDQARQAAQNAGIDPDIFARQIQQESGFNPNAKSGAGALGIAQFMPSTAQGLGIDPMNPQQALNAAAQMDANNLQKYNGDWSKTLAAYNAGGGAVDQYNGVPPYQETQNYVQTILGGAQGVTQQIGQAVGGAASAVGSTLSAAQQQAQNLSQQLLQESQLEAQNLSQSLLQQGQNALTGLNTLGTGLGTGAQDLTNQILQQGQNLLGQPMDAASQLSQQLLQQGQQNLLTPAQNLSQQLLQQGQNALGGVGQLGDLLPPTDQLTQNLLQQGANFAQPLSTFAGTAYNTLQQQNQDQLNQILGLPQTLATTVQAGQQGNLSGFLGGAAQLGGALQNATPMVSPQGDVSSAVSAGLTAAGVDPNVSRVLGQIANAAAMEGVEAGVPRAMEALPELGGEVLSRGLGALDVLNPPEAAFAKTIGPEGPGPSTIYGPAGEILSQVNPAAATAESALQAPAEAAQRAVNIDLSRFPQAAQPVISSMAESMPETMTAATRGVVSDPTVRALSQDLGMNPSEVVANWQPGQAFNAETLVSVRDALAAQSQRVLDAQEVLRQNPNDLQARTNFMSELLQQGALQEVVTGATAEAGRALRAIAQPVEGSQFAAQKMAEMAQRYGMNQDDLVSMLSRMDLADPAQVSQLARLADPQAPPSLSDLFHLYYTGSLVSGLQTVGKVAMNSIIAPAWNFATNGIYDLATFQPSRASGSAVAALGTLKGVLPDFFSGFRGFYTRDASVGQQFAEAGMPIRSAIARVFETPMAVHAGLQQVSQDIVANMELGRIAGTQATREGLSGDAWFSRVQDLINNPQPGWLDTAQGVGKRAALRGDLGWFGSTMQNFIQRLGPVGETIWPVFRIGMNFQTQRIEQSLIGLGGTLIDAVRGIALKQGPYAGASLSDVLPALRGETAGMTAEQAQRFAENPFVSPADTAVSPLRERFINNTIGTAISVGAAIYGLQGNVTGAGPEDSEERANLMAQGWQPYSVLLGDRYVSYQHLPGAYALALIGNYADAVNYPSQQEKTDILSGRAPLGVVPGTASRVDFAAERYVKSMFELMGSEAGLTQLTDMVDTLTSGAAANAGGQALGGVAQGFLPMSGALRSIASMTDPYQREPQSLNPLTIAAQSVAENIPGLRQMVPLRQGPLGEPLPNPQAGVAGIAPMPTRQVAGNPILAAYGVAGETLPQPPQAIGYGQGRQILLDPNEQQAYQRYEGDMIQRVIQPIMDSGQWQQMNTMTQRAVLQRVEPVAQRYAQGMLLTQMSPQQAQARAQWAPSSALYPAVSYEPPALANTYLGQMALQQQLAQHQRFMQQMQQPQSLLQVPSQLQQGVPALT